MASVTEQLTATATRIGQEIKAVYAALAGKATDSAVVHKTGTETIQGNKSIPAGSGNEWAFNQPVQVAVGTQAYHAVRRDHTSLTADQAAGTASVRTLGTAATSAAAGNDGRFSQVAANTQTASYTLVLADAGKAVEMNVAGANTLTVPPNSSVAFPVGTVLEVCQYGAGQTTITAGAGVTLRAPDGAKTAKQYASASIRKRGTDEWIVAGAVTL